MRAGMQYSAARADTGREMKRGEEGSWPELISSLAHRRDVTRMICMNRKRRSNLPQPHIQCELPHHFSHLSLTVGVTN